MATERPNWTSREWKREHDHTTPGPDCDLTIHTATPKPRLRGHMVRDHYTPSGWATYVTLDIAKECHNFDHGLDAFGNRLDDPRNDERAAFNVDSEASR